MPREIERKFLVRDEGIVAGRLGDRIVQGYVAKEAGAMSTRVRIRGQRGFITLKGPHEGLGRDEFEYVIPVEDAWNLLTEHCGNRIVEKTRYLIEHDSLVFEVDVFAGRHAGLVIAELELSHEDQRVCLPHWIGDEITGDKRFGNFALAQFEGPVAPLQRPVPPPFPLSRAPQRGALTRRDGA